MSSKRRGICGSLKRATRVAGGIVAVTLLLLGCQTPKQQHPEQSKAAISLRITGTTVSATDLDTVRLEFVATATNTNSREVTVTAATANLTVQDVPAGVWRQTAPVQVPAHGTATILIRYTVRLSELFTSLPGLRTAGTAFWHLAVSATASIQGGAALPVMETAADGRFPVIQKPSISILSLHIERYDLIESKLTLTLAVHNPNVFPVNFRSITYQFSADDRTWGDGTEDLPEPVAAGTTVQVPVPLRLNFIEMGRKVLDTVAGLGIVKYHLAGNASVTTPLDFIPRFTMDFDRRGSVRVQK